MARAGADEHETMPMRLSFCHRLEEHLGLLEALVRQAVRPGPRPLLSQLPEQGVPEVRGEVVLIVAPAVLAQRTQFVSIRSMDHGRLQEACCPYASVRCTVRTRCAGR